MKYQILKFEIKNRIGILTISRPESLNALNKRFFTELDWLLSTIQKEKEILALIITGDGKSFVAGADIGEMAGMDGKEATDFSITGQRVFEMIEHAPFPVIAAVNGFALGGGCELALACDIRLASDKAKFGQPEVNLGLIPGFAGTQRLSRLIGLGSALYLIYSGEMIDAQEAYRLGLVQKIFTTDELLDEAVKLAETFASKGKNAIKMVKQVARLGAQMSFDDACRLEARNFGTLFGKDEMLEGTRAFLEKRKPEWPA
jgi:enoyl-CoA hydratase